MSEDCKHCIFNETEENCPGCWEGSHFKSKPPQKRIVTNADRIRNMTDAELADWLIMNGDGSDYETWLKWLKQECE